MSAGKVTAEFYGAARIPGRDCSISDVATVELADEDAVFIRAGDASIELSVSGALEIAEFILRNAVEQ